MKRAHKISSWLLILVLLFSPVAVVVAQQHDAVNQKMIVYQMMVRLFSNKNQTNACYGSIQQNGVGKFNDINDSALDALKKLGVNHVWYTGVIAHATMTDYAAFGIQPDDPDIVKGRAGSPYAIRDYYDVDPDLAVNVNERMTEFESLVARTHQHELKVLIDFVPNHVARTYHSKTNTFGANDDTTKAFSASNDFYYIPGKSFIVPDGVNAGGDSFKSPLKDGKFAETPAKATGNNVFSNKPSIDDWYETIKLNYGVDYLNKEEKHFQPIPPVWIKMRDILLFWAGKKVDGFRCDMAEMVPVEFWSWAIPQVKKVNPAIVFIAEAYNPEVYSSYLGQGGFDYLYDKVGLYDAIKRLTKNEEKGSTKDIVNIAGNERSNYYGRLLRFMENHDEERIASKGFAQGAWNAVPGMVVSATLSNGPLMLYFGQEVGERGEGKEGFGGEDNRTTMFDYWGVPAHQQWMNNGAFDGGRLSTDQQALRTFYYKLLNAVKNNEAICKGKFVAIDQPELGDKVLAYIRYTEKKKLLVVANFNTNKAFDGDIVLPAEIAVNKQSIIVTDILSNKKRTLKNAGKGINVMVPSMRAVILEID